jgi:hypothetical protein
MKKISVLIFISLIFVMVSCNKTSLKPVSTSGSKTANSMSNLQVPANFNWKTTQSINLTITANKNNLVNVTSKDGISYQKAFLSANNPYTMKLVIPAYAKVLNLNFMGQKVALNITSENMNYQFK